MLGYIYYICFVKLVFSDSNEKKVTRNVVEYF